MRLAKHNNRGFSLLEVLIALLVLSLGLLGLAALQTVGMRFNHQSYGRTQAAFQIYDIVDRMRANRAGLTAHANYDSVTVSSSPPSGNDCLIANCDSANLANFDIRTWKTGTAALLPEGRGGVCRGSFNSDFTTCTVGGSVYRIVVSWREHDLTQYFEAETQL